MNSGVYIIINRITGVVYIGSTVDFRRRWSDHKGALRQNRHCNPHLQSSWNRHGENTFKFGILEYLDNQDDLYLAEQFWMGVYQEESRELYNIALVADSPMRGRSHTEATKQKMSEAAKGNQHALGYRHSEKAKRRISEANIGKKVSEEHIQNWRRAREGYSHTRETRLKIGKAGKGRIVSKETRQKISRAQKDRKRSPMSREAKLKLSKINKGKKLSKETRRNISKAGGRPYPVFVHKETGEIIPAGVNLSALCRDRGLGAQGMSDVKCGRQRSHKGWSLSVVPEDKGP